MPASTMSSVSEPPLPGLQQPAPAAAPALALGLIVSSTVLGIAGTDLVLPAVPTLPAALGGDLAQAQLVLAAFVAGSALGLLGFGALGARFDQRRLLLASLASYGVLSLCATAVPGLGWLIALRFLQGAAGSAAAVFAPGMIRALYGDGQAVSILGRLGSVEALTPALAPIAGTWLLQAHGWGACFGVLGGGALGLATVVAASGKLLPAPVTQRAGGGYATLLRDRTFLRYALGHACTLGGLLVFVFGSPTVFVAALGATLGDFIVMQVTGIATFIVGANLTGRLSRALGAERAIWIGSILSAAGAAGLLCHALLGGRDPLCIAALFVPLNLGLGLRGPPGFHRAVLAARGDDARGAALVVVAVLVCTAAGTALVAPFITYGLVPLALAALVLTASSLLLSSWLPALPAS